MDACVTAALRTRLNLSEHATAPLHATVTSQTSCHETVTQHSHAVQGVARDAAVAYYGDATQEIEREPVVKRRDDGLFEGFDNLSRSRPPTTFAKTWERRSPSSCVKGRRVQQQRRTSSDGLPRWLSGPPAECAGASVPRAARHLPTDRGRSIRQRVAHAARKQRLAAKRQPGAAAQQFASCGCACCGKCRARQAARAGSRDALCRCCSCSDCRRRRHAGRQTIQTVRGASSHIAQIAASSS